MTTRPLRILWTLPYLPWPTTSGGKLRQYHLLRCMAARGHRITLLVQSKTPLDAATRQQLEPLLERLIVLPRRPLRSWRTMLAALASPLPLLASVNGYAAALAQRFDALLEEHWDVVQIEHSYAFQPYATALARHRQPFVLTEHNVESSLSAATYRRLPVPLRQLACIDHWRYRRWERDVLRRATRLVALTTADAAAFKRLSGRSASLVVNGTETDAFAAVQPNPAAQRVMYVGNFEYAPNVDAVAWLLSEIMPRVWKRLPQARLSLCGHAMPATWRKRWPDPRIEWLGYVEQLAAVQARASAFVAPLRDGGGSKLKVIEAMAAGLPLASTAQGVSGLDVRDGVHFRQGDDAESLAAALAGLLQSPTEALRLGEAGRNYVREQHDWNISAAQLEAVYRELGDSHVGVPACA